jgi:hypothetical protein
MIIVESKNLVPNGYLGFVVFPFIFLKKGLDKSSEKYKRLFNHEMIHVKQQLELVVVLFFLLYGLNYLINLIKYKSIDLAYKNIIFEHEAYSNEKDLNYLKTRKRYNWVKYLRGK